MHQLHEAAQAVLDAKLRGLAPVSVSEVDECGYFAVNHKTPHIFETLGVKVQQRRQICDSVAHELDFAAYMAGPSFSLKSRRFSLLVQRGIPLSMKEKVYRVLLQTQRDLNYAELLRDAQNAAYIGQIAKDLARTMPNKYFLTFSETKAQLFRVLAAFATSSALGYMQGMNFPAAYFLQFFDEETAFAMFAEFMDRNGSVFNLATGLQKMIGTLRAAVAYELPELYQYMENMGIEFETFAPQWFLTFYNACLPARLFERVFDLIVFYGERATVRVAVQLLRIAQSGERFTHQFGPDDPAHDDAFELFLLQLTEKQRRSGISCLGMPNAQCLEWIYNVGRGIGDGDYFVFDVVSFLHCFILYWYSDQMGKRFALLAQGLATAIDVRFLSNARFNAFLSCAALFCILQCWVGALGVYVMAKKQVLRRDEGQDFCRSCGLHRRPNTHHCAQCSVCVVGFDHHCDYFGVCLGGLNLAYFVKFVVYNAVSCFFYAALGLQRKQLGYLLFKLMCCGIYCFFAAVLLPDSLWRDGRSKMGLKFALKVAF